ncbi:hypothetical protein ACO22_02056 [Paracoccidioides brasiliensis]|uniref:Uncharacterized protein n=1 Tax=Paracoccidioides brasiliensis TaxID=121759 RepID=A0A1D2JJR7_PARBR|nr:hypothetical protein ACO22_02056 [Paracoccidioides brasiliensis]
MKEGEVGDAEVEEQKGMTGDDAEDPGKEISLRLSHGDVEAQPVAVPIRYPQRERYVPADTTAAEACRMWSNSQGARGTKSKPATPSRRTLSEATRHHRYDTIDTPMDWGIRFLERAFRALAITRLRKVTQTPMAPEGGVGVVTFRLCSGGSSSSSIMLL